MRIRLRFPAAGPGVNHDAGAEVDFPRDQAVQLVRDGMADAIDPMPAERADLSPKGETTEVKGPTARPSPLSTAKP